MYFQGILFEFTPALAGGARNKKIGAGRAAGREERQAALRELPWRNHGVIISQASAEIYERRKRRK